MVYHFCRLDNFSVKFIIKLSISELKPEIAFEFNVFTIVSQEIRKNCCLEIILSELNFLRLDNNIIAPALLLVLVFIVRQFYR